MTRDDAPTLLAVHAHPDDEAIATGGVLLQAADAGWRTRVVSCTGGERGEVVGEGMDPEEVRPRLGEVRRAEQAAALEILGAGEPLWLGYRDSGMVGDPGNDDPASFWRAPFDEAVERLVAIIRRERPTLVITYDAFGIYGHPDHLQAHRVTLCAVEAAAVPALHPAAGPAWEVSALDLATLSRSAIAQMNRMLPEHGTVSPFGDETDPDALEVGTPDAAIDLVVDVRAQLDRKLAALRQHHSQLALDSFFVGVPDEVAELALGTEAYQRRRGAVVDPRDPLAGLG